MLAVTDALAARPQTARVSDLALEPAVGRSRGGGDRRLGPVTCARRIAQAAVVRSSQASFPPLTALTFEPILRRRLKLKLENAERDRRFSGCVAIASARRQASATHLAPLAARTRSAQRLRPPMFGRPHAERTASRPRCWPPVCGAHSVSGPDVRPPACGAHSVSGPMSRFAGGIGCQRCLRFALSAIYPVCTQVLVLQNIGVFLLRQEC